MAITTADILALVKTRLRLLDVSLDSLINSYIPELENRILHYCNVDVVPDGLMFTWASMVIDTLRIEQSSVQEIADTSDTGETIKLGDTSVAPAKSSGVSNLTKSVIDGVALNYTVDLDHYRKLRW